MTKKNILIIGLAGPYGAGCSSLAGDFEKTVKNWPGCKVKLIHVADLIEGYYYHFTGKTLNIDESDLSRKRKTLQSAGTALRKIDPELIGKLISSTIKDDNDTITNNKNNNDIKVIVFIVDSLKNKHDLQLLRRTYLNEFYFVFNYADRETRWRRMVDYKSWDKNDRVKFEKRDSVDQNEKTDHPDVGDCGQQVQKLASKADFYIVNNNNREKLSEDGKRLIRLLFGDVRNQPTIHERFMHIAFSASNASFCLSRQVGAAIVDSFGTLLGVGHNDVPKANGGLYSTEDRVDRRCYSVGDRSCINDINKKERFKDLSNAIIKEFALICSKSKLSRIIEDSSFNDTNEKERFEELSDVIIKQFALSDIKLRLLKIFKDPSFNEINKEERFEELSDVIIKEFTLSDVKSKLLKIIKDSSFSEVIEYCRAVHAEMDALLSVARTAKGKTCGATMYVTTEPCHNCTKHIISAGIKKVFFMEPYPKSLGLELHSDAIAIGAEIEKCTGNKVLFIPYEGVGPHRFHDFFALKDDRKDSSGKFIYKSKEELSSSPKFAIDSIQRFEDSTDPISIRELKNVQDIGDFIKSKDKAK